MACSGAALSSTRVEQLNKLNEQVAQLHGRVELDSPPGFGECSRCGRDGPNDYNCCHAGGAWAGMCGDEAMVVEYAVLRIIRGVRASLSVKNATHKRSFKRPIGTIYRKCGGVRSALKQIRPRRPKDSWLAEEHSIYSISGKRDGERRQRRGVLRRGLAEQDDAEFEPYGAGISADAKPSTPHIASSRLRIRCGSIPTLHSLCIAPGDGTIH